jgi:hypothetical protein
MKKALLDNGHRSANENYAHIDLIIDTQLSIIPSAFNYKYKKAVKKR